MDELLGRKLDDDCEPGMTPQAAAIKQWVERTAGGGRARPVARTRPRHAEEAAVEETSCAAKAAAAGAAALGMDFGDVGSSIASRSAIPPQHAACPGAPRKRPHKRDVAPDFVDVTSPPSAGARRSLLDFFESVAAQAQPARRANSPTTSPSVTGRPANGRRRDNGDSPSTPSNDKHPEEQPKGDWITADGTWLETDKNVFW